MKIKNLATLLSIPLIASCATSPINSERKTQTLGQGYLARIFYADEFFIKYGINFKDLDLENIKKIYEKFELQKAGLTYDILIRYEFLLKEKKFATKDAMMVEWMQKDIRCYEKRMENILEEYKDSILNKNRLESEFDQQNKDGELKN
jgi:hypothetical protein